MKPAYAVVWSVALALAAPAHAQEIPEWAKSTTVSGYLFGDLYWVAAHDNKDEVQGQNGFWVRRLYLTLDSALGEKWGSRLRLEANSPGDFKSKDKLVPFFKDAYLSWKATPRHELFFGLSQTPTWELLEAVWGYRSIEKTPLDLYKMGAARDFGIAARGALDSGKKFRYHTMLGNGSETGGETNKGKKIMLALGFFPSDTFLVEAYTDVEDLPNAAKRTTVQSFAAYRTTGGRVGVHIARQDRTDEQGGRSTLSVASVWAVKRLSETLNLVGRFDRTLDPNPAGRSISYIPFDNTAESNFAVIGLDWAPHKKVNVIPNVEVVRYARPDRGRRPGATVIPRVTLFYRFP